MNKNKNKYSEKCFKNPDTNFNLNERSSHFEQETDLSDINQTLNDNGNINETTVSDIDQTLNDNGNLNETTVLRGKQPGLLYKHAFDLKNVYNEDTLGISLFKYML